jgi:hypothetical protein
MSPPSTRHVHPSCLRKWQRGNRPLICLGQSSSAVESQGTPKGMEQLQAKWFATGAIENFGDFRADEAFGPFSFFR